jgi:hypothetical protein
VKIELHGSDKQSGLVALEDTGAECPFRRGCTDSFSCTCLNISPIQKLSVVAEAPDDCEKAWFLKWVAVQAPGGPWVYFTFGCWIATNMPCSRFALLQFGISLGHRVTLPMHSSRRVALALSYDVKSHCHGKK